GLEQELKTNDAIYSMMSPVTLVEEIADKQSDTFKEGIVDVIDGLDEMGGQLSDIGEELEENAESSPDMEFPDMGIWNFRRWKIRSYLNLEDLSSLRRKARVYLSSENLNFLSRAS